MIRFLFALPNIVMCLALAACVTVQDPTTTRRAAPVSGNAQITSAAHANTLNALRARHGLGAVRPDATLGRIAQNHTHDMMANGFFGHVSSNGDTFVTRTRAQGYGFCHLAENLAKGTPAFDNVLGQWMRSAGHRRNLMNPHVTEFGLAQGPGNLWVLVLGQPGC